MANHSFSFNEAETLDINGETFTINKSEENALKYAKDFERAQQTMAEFQGLDIDKATTEDMERMFAEIKNTQRVYFDTVLGEGSYDRLYELSGGSLVEIMGLMTFIREKQEDSVNKAAAEQSKKYTKKVNK